MEEQDYSELPLPLCGINNADTLINNTGDIAGLQVPFEEAYRFCALPLGGMQELKTVYGHGQIQFNNMSGQIVLVLTDALSNAFENQESLFEGLRPFGPILTDYLGTYGKTLPGKIASSTLSTMLDASPAELFFSYIGFCRQVLACCAAPDNRDNQDFGRPRYLSHDRAGLYTPLTAPRYLPSMERARSGNALATYIEQCKAERLADFEDESSEDRPSPEIQAYYLSQYDDMDYFEIVRTIEDHTIRFGKVVRFEDLENYTISEDEYRVVYDEIDRYFALLMAPDLPDVRQFLDAVFRVQYWFIMITPFHRGSAAAMGLFRHAMTAWYNYRIRGTNLRPLPVVPSRPGFHPDLEALLCCLTADDFVSHSMAGLYCVDYNAYCDD
jgi:hypothetical protein